MNPTPEQVILASNPGSDGVPMWMLFDAPTPELSALLEARDAFIVAADAACLGAFASASGAAPPAIGSSPVFYNTMAMDGWEIAANVGEAAPDGGYSNVLIIKGRQLPLLDLVRNPGQWTSGMSGGDPAGLSAWLADYVQAAIEAGTVGEDPYFIEFARIAANPMWTGVLVLKATLLALPPALGVALPDLGLGNAYVHHFGINGSSSAQAGASSMFQLMYVTNPEGAAPVSTLKALFVNSALSMSECRR
jgi:hypothetical protein